MYRPAQVERLAMVIAAILTLSACATLRVNSHLERDADFGRYHSYAWGAPAALSTGDPRLDNNRFFSDRVEAAVDRQLQRRRFEKTGAGAADLVIHLHTRVDQRLDTTMMLDFVDGRTNRLAWRGWAEGILDGVIDDQQLMEEAVDNAVERILARLPN
jgi:hypothetical protein